MEKRKLRRLELIDFPEIIPLEKLKGEISYLYAAREVIIEDAPLLEIDFFSIALNRIIFRIFVSDSDYVNQIIDDSGKTKWSVTRFMWILDIYHYSFAVPIDEISETLIYAFLDKCKYSDSLKNTNEIYENPLYSLDRFQGHIKRLARLKRHKSITDRIDKAFENIEDLPEDIYDWIEQYPLHKKQYIFYKRKGKKKIDGYCSYCNCDVSLEYAKHNETGICPSCNNEITYKAVGRVKKLYDDFRFIYIQKGNDGALIERVFEGYKTYYEGIRKPNVLFSEKRRYIYKENTESPKPYHYGNFKLTRQYRWCEGYPPKYYRFGYLGGFSDTGYIYHANLMEAFKETALFDSGIIYFAKLKHPCDFFELYHLCRGGNDAIKYVILNGFEYLVNEESTRRLDYGEYRFNQFTQSFAETLFQYKAYWRLFKEIRITPDEIFMLSHFPHPRYLKKDIILWYREKEIVNDMAPILRFITPVRARNYLQKMAAKLGSEKDVINIWADYLNFSDMLNYDMASDFVLFPLSLEKRHDELFKEYETVCKLGGNVNISPELHYKLEATYGFSDDNFTIIVPASHDEIKREGSTLHHCVGGEYYVKNMVNLQTVILFLRRNTDLTTPFYTIEYKKGKVNQCYGYFHAKATSEVSAFLTKWKMQLGKPRTSKVIAKTAA